MNAGAGWVGFVLFCFLMNQSKHSFNHKIRIYRVISASIILEWSHSLYGTEEEAIDDIRGNFIVLNLPYLYYSDCSVYCVLCALIKFDWCFPFKVDNECSTLELTFGVHFGDSFFLIHEIEIM